MLLKNVTKQVERNLNGEFPERQTTKQIIWVLKSCVILKMERTMNKLWFRLVITWDIGHLTDFVWEIDGINNLNYNDP